MKQKIKMSDMSNKDGQLIDIAKADLMPLPYPYDKPENEPAFKQLTDKQKEEYECSLDGVVNVAIPKPKSKAEEEELVKKFLKGLKKLLSKEDNWTFLQPLLLTLEYCGKCQTCNEACPVYISSGKQDIYRPTFRSEILRRLVKKYVKNESDIIAKFTEKSGIELNWETIARLAELSYRCTLCRRCAQTCPIGIDNALISREIRKLLSQELGIAPKPLHTQGTVQQLKVGASTGISTKAFANMIKFMEDEIEEKTGKNIKIPVDKEGADILLIHNTGEFMSWPENVEAFAIIFEAAGINWTLASEIGGYEATNYGVWYDDFQFSRIAINQAQVAKNLKVKSIAMGECGHAHKAAIVIADRVLTGEMNIPTQSCMPILEDIVCNGKIKLDPKRNDFPVTLHDPCNMVRLMGIVEPQRKIIRKICPQFREMEPHGVENYCCGGGSGFAITQSMNFPDWRSSISGRMKLKQILDAFQDVIDPEIKKYVCAPCSNCKGQIRDLFEYYEMWEKTGTLYGGLVELIVNAMTDIEKPFIDWEWH